jgi:hypothetical protein
VNDVTATERMTQDAPYPTILADLVQRLRLDPGWSVRLSDAQRDTGSPDQGFGLTLGITTVSFDTYHPERGREYRVLHQFPVPPATYNEQSWTRWLFDRYVDVLTHEGMEFFRLHGGEAGGDYRPYAPNHGPGNDPYVVRELTTDLDRRTQYTGTVDHR